MDLGTVLRFLHIVFGALLLGQTLEDWLWSRSWPGQPRRDVLIQFRKQAREEPRKVVVLFGTLITGIVLVFVKLEGAFSGWLWLSIGLSVVVIALASLVEGAGLWRHAEAPRSRPGERRLRRRSSLYGPSKGVLRPDPLGVGDYHLPDGLPTVLINCEGRLRFPPSAVIIGVIFAVRRHHLSEPGY